MNRCAGARLSLARATFTCNWKCGKCVVCSVCTCLLKGNTLHIFLHFFSFLSFVCFFFHFSRVARSCLLGIAGDLFGVIHAMQPNEYEKQANESTPTMITTAHHTHTDLATKWPAKRIVSTCVSVCVCTVCTSQNLNFSAANHNARESDSWSVLVYLWQFYIYSAHTNTHIHTHIDGRDKIGKSLLKSFARRLFVRSLFRPAHGVETFAQ